MPLDPETVDQMSDDERRDLLGWLEDLVQYVKLKLGSEALEEKPKPDDPRPDPVGDIVILDHKQQQAKAMSGRKPSRWMSVGFDQKVDDKHV